MSTFTSDEFDDSFNVRLRDSFNTTNTTNNANVAVDLDHVGNADHSVNDSGNVTADLDGVGNADHSVNDSGNTAVWLDGVGNTDSHDMALDIDDSFNDESDNSWTDNSDHSVNGSYNDETHEATYGSHNTYWNESMDDHSVTVGARDYSTGFGDVSFGGGGAGGGGDLWVNNQNTIVDQSVNANVAGWGGAEFVGGSSAVVASGDGAMAAGGDLNLSQIADHSTHISAHGDLNMNNTTEAISISGSYNDVVDSSSWTDGSTHVDVDDSFNDMSDSYTADNSFNDELVSHTEETWNVDADVIWGSDDSAIVDEVAPEMSFEGM